MQDPIYNIVLNILISKCQKYTAIILDYARICTYTVESYICIASMFLFLENSSIGFIPFNSSICSLVFIFVNYF